MTRLRVAVLLAVLLGGACGTRMDHDAVVKAAGSSRLATTIGTGSGDASGAALVAGDASTPAGAGSSGVIAGASGAGDASGSPTAAPPRGAPATAGAPTVGVVPGATGAKNDIVVASLGNYSGIAGGVFGGGNVALQAWARAVNEGGGIDGHPVRLIVADDNGDPARHRQVAQQLIEARGVIAFINDYAPLTGFASVEYMNTKKVPVISGLVSDKYFATSPMHFPAGGAYDRFHYSMVAGAADQLRRKGKTKLAVFGCAEATTCKEGVPFYERFAKQFGFQVVYKGQVSIAQPDFTAECLSSRNAGAEAMFLALDGSTLRRFASSCSRQAFKPTWAIPILGLQLTMPGVPELEGTASGGVVYPWFLNGEPGAVEYHNALTKFAPGVSLPSIGLEAWTSAKLFQKAITGRVGAKPAAANVLDGLWAMKGETVDGLTQPLNFARGRGNPQRYCSYSVLITGGKFTSPDNGKLNCT